MERDGERVGDEVLVIGPRDVVFANERLDVEATITLRMIDFRGRRSISYLTGPPTERVPRLRE